MRMRTGSPSATVNRACQHVVVERELGLDARLVVAESLQRLADSGGRGAIELLHSPARRIAGLVVEIEVGEDVGGELTF